jgi:hypothetical protein
VHAQGEAAKAAPAMPAVRTLHDAAQHKLTDLTAQMETTNLESLRCVEAWLTSALVPLMNFASRIKVNGEMLELVADNFKLCMFVTAMAEQAIMASAYSGREPFMLGDERFGRALLKIKDAGCLPERAQAE